jgi:hypothetical protein
MYIGLNVRSLVQGPVTLHHERQVIVDDHVDLEDIDATGDDVGGDEDLFASLAETVDDGIAVFSVLGAMERGDLVSFCDHALSDTIGGASLLAKDDTLADGEQTVQGDENVVFVLLVAAVHVELADAFDGEFFSLEFDLVGVGGELVGKGADVIGEGGREEDGLVLAGAGDLAGKQ